MEEETLKKHRTPSRVVVINEVQEIIAQMRTIVWSPEATADTVLTILSDRVETLKEGRPKVDKDDTTVAALPKRGGGTHFVGITGDEKAVYLHRTTDGVYHTDDGNAETVAHIYGPFNTPDGARYAAKHGTYDQRPQVM